MLNENHILDIFYYLHIYSDELLKLNIKALIDMKDGNIVVDEKGQFHYINN